MDNIIFPLITRRLKLTGHPALLEGRVNLGPVVHEDSGEFSCGFNVDFDPTTSGKIYGEDAYQAIQLCIGFLDAVMASGRLGGVEFEWYGNPPK
jgi:hypothetical protein